MRYKNIFTLVLLFTVLLAGCSGNSRSKGEAGITGYVMKIADERILVVDSEAEDFSSTDGLEEFYNAIWFSNAPDDILVGQKVKVWFDIVRDSYPGQSEVMHLEIIPGEKPAGANLSESDALFKALTSEDMAGLDVTAVRLIEYHNEKNLWTIELKDVWSDTTYTMEIADK